MSRKGPYGRTPSGKPKTLGERIAAIRRAWGWTQADLASQLRIKTASVSAWERGKSQPAGSSLVSLAALLNTSPEALIGELAFSIPDLPQGVAEPHWKAYRLPLPSDYDQVLLVKDGSVIKAAPLKELRGLASEAIQEGRPVWLVIGCAEKS